MNKVKPNEEYLEINERKSESKSIIESPRTSFAQIVHKKLPVVKPGNQTRRFTHINDTVEICYLAWKKNLCRHYSIANHKIYSILQVAKMFKTKIRYLPRRPGERYSSKLSSSNLSNKVYKYFGKIDLKKYIKNFLINV